MHYVDVRSAAHETNPNEERTEYVERLDPHVMGVEEHENEVKCLQDRQYPHFLNFDVLEGASADKDADLVACV